VLGYSEFGNVTVFLEKIVCLVGVKMELGSGFVEEILAKEKSLL